MRFIILLLAACAVFADPKWVQLPNNNAPPVMRESSAAGVINGVLYFLAGMRHCNGAGPVCGNDPCNNTFYNQVDSYNLGTGLWSSNIAASSPAPNLLAFPGYIVAPARKSILLYGGTSFQGGSTSSCNVQFFDGLWEFNTVTNTWARIDSASDPNTPGARVSPGLVLVGNTLYLFGGLKSPGIIKNDLHTFNFASGLWSVVSVAGPLPSARYHVRAAYDDSNNQIVAVWGDNFLAPSIPPPVYINDVIAFDLASSTWRVIEHSKHANYHPIMAIYKGHMYVAYGDPRPKPLDVNFEGNVSLSASVDVECEDDVTGFSSAEADIHYILDVAPGAGKNLQRFYPQYTADKLKMAAYTTDKKTLYVVGGFSLDCPKFVPAGVNQTTVTQYLDHVHTFDMTKIKV